MSRERDCSLWELSGSRKPQLARPPHDPPTIANGKVFVPTAGSVEQLQHYTGGRPFSPNKSYYLAVYGLK